MSSVDEDVESFLEAHGVDPGLADQLKDMVRSRFVSVATTRLSMGPVAVDDEGDRDEPAPAPRSANEPSSAPEIPPTLPPQRDDPITHVEEIEQLPRLEFMQLLAEGGMGQVYRTQDNTLDRRLAMKVLHAELSGRQMMRMVFTDEARITAQLAHPSIPPVHEVGELGDGRPFFTMKEVVGRTLQEILAEDLRAEGWTAWRTMEVYQRVCEALAYSHASGVIHCDIKPANIMVGAFGEVMLMDWGVARAIDEDLDNPRFPGLAAMHGMVAGTPGYMPPEQARGQTNLMGPPADVFAMGVLLYEVLGGLRPYGGTNKEIVKAALRGEVPALPDTASKMVDDSLWGIIVKALSPHPDDRYPNAGALAEDIKRWREGALQREKALGAVREAEKALPEATPRKSRARKLRAQAERRLEALGPDASAAEKARAWDLEDWADDLDREVRQLRAEASQLLQTALAQSPGLVEARRLLARIEHDNHRDAVARRAHDEAALAELRLRAADIGEFADYLAGTAPLSLATDVPCEARLLRYMVRKRRVQPEFIRKLGTTPLVNVELPVGPYVLELVSGDGPTALYPVVLERREPWSGIRPGASTPHPVHIPGTGDLDADECYVPAGPFWFGGDPDADGARRRKNFWLDGFVMQRYPVTNRDMARFLASPDGAPWREGVFRDGLSLWKPDWPAVGLSWDAAVAYAAWFAARTGRGWRLPSEAEWEKAARGVGHRAFPWGDFGDAAFCHARTPEHAPRRPVAVGTFETDHSPYGVHDMGGNVRDWCLDPYTAEGPVVVDGVAVLPRGEAEAVDRVVRGGSWRQPLVSARVAGRSPLPRDQGHADVGVRLVRSYPETL